MFMHKQTTFFPEATADLPQAEMIDLEVMMFPGTLSRSGIIEGTKVEAADGWRCVETLTTGDAVYTFDGGLRQITATHREMVRPARTLLVPGGALDNCADMMLLPGQHMLLESLWAEARFGSPLALVPAAALAGYHGITWVNSTAKMAEIITLEFDEEEVVYANTGALCHCPNAIQHGAARLISRFFSVLDLDQARALVLHMATDEKIDLDLRAA